MFDKKHMICSCVSPDFDELRCGDVNDFSDLIDSGVEISKRSFLEHCHVDDDIKRNINRFPDDYGFYQGKGKNRDVFLFEHRAIEHFFK